MRNVSCKCRIAVAAAGVMMVAIAGEARAESRFPGCRNERVLPFKSLFSATFNDLKRLPTANNAGILAIGGGAALLSHPADKSVTKKFSASAGLEETLEGGAVLGGFPLQIGGAFVTYGLGRKGYDITPEEKADKDNPYNTYAHTGLPVGPINSPGGPAIDAAANPDDVPYYYWVTVNLDTGETKFSETLEEHNAYTKEYLKWCSEQDEGRCD